MRMGGTELTVSAPTPLCGMTMRPQGALPHDASMLRTIVRQGSQTPGVGTNVLRAGCVRVGDAVLLID
jgi:MOSC domain-containing protein YiiM